MSCLNLSPFSNAPGRLLNCHHNFSGRGFFSRKSEHHAWVRLWKFWTINQPLNNFIARLFFQRNGLIFFTNWKCRWPQIFEQFSLKFWKVYPKILQVPEYIVYNLLVPELHTSTVVLCAMGQAPVWRINNRRFFMHNVWFIYLLTC